MIGLRKKNIIKKKFSYSDRKIKDFGINVSEFLTLGPFDIYQELLVSTSFPKTTINVQCIKVLQLKLLSIQSDLQNKKTQP